MEFSEFCDNHSKYKNNRFILLIRVDSNYHGLDIENTITHPYFENCVMLVLVGQLAEKYEDIIDDLVVTNDISFFPTAVVESVEEAIDLTRSWQFDIMLTHNIDEEIP